MKGVFNMNNVDDIMKILDDNRLCVCVAVPGGAENLNFGSPPHNLSTT